MLNFGANGVQCETIQCYYVKQSFSKQQPIMNSFNLIQKLGINIETCPWSAVTFNVKIYQFNKYVNMLYKYHICVKCLLFLTMQCYLNNDGHYISPPRSLASKFCWSWTIVVGQLGGGKVLRQSSLGIS